MPVVSPRPAPGDASLVAARGRLLASRAMPPRALTPSRTPRRSWRRVGAALVVVLAGLALRAPAARADDFETALATYKAMLKRPSLYKRTQGRARFASAGFAQALPTLVDD